MKREISLPVAIIIIGCVVVAVVAFGYARTRSTQNTVDMKQMMQSMSQPKPSQTFVPKYNGQ